MKNRKATYLLFGLLHFFWVNIALADTIHVEYRPLDEDNYEEAKGDLDYSDENIPEYEDDYDLDPWEGFDFGDWSFLAEIFKVLAIIIVVGGLGFLLFKLFDEHILKRDKKINLAQNVLIDNLEEYIHEVDLDKLLQETLAKKNYKLAVRVQYLMIVKSLSNAELIFWKKEKTNGEYLQEVFGKPIFESYQKSTTLFERIWYGDVEIDQNRYERVSPKLKETLSKIPKPKHDK